jgi:hypothetical protein
MGTVPQSSGQALLSSWVEVCWSPKPTGAVLLWTRLSPRQYLNQNKQNIFFLNINNLYCCAADPVRFVPSSTDLSRPARNRSGQSEIIKTEKGKKFQKIRYPVPYVTNVSRWYRNCKQYLIATYRYRTQLTYGTQMNVKPRSTEVR